MSFCKHHDQGTCLSCPLLSLDSATQLEQKSQQIKELLAPFGPPEVWLDPVASSSFLFRNKAKMVVTGTAADPVLGLAPLNGGPIGVDLTDCPLYVPEITATFPALKEFIRSAQLAPYDLTSAAIRVTPKEAAQRGELKNVIITAAPTGALMLRLVLRSRATEARIRSRLPQLLAALPQLQVVSLNIHPDHKATLAGDLEIYLTDTHRISFPFGSVTTFVGPRSFLQTNTAVATQLYSQAAQWVSALSPHQVWDLYCGVGGFSLALAAPGRAVTGIEIIPEAISNAQAAANLLVEAGDLPSQVRLPNAETLANETNALEAACDSVLGTLEFRVDDAVEYAKNFPGLPPDVVIVNPPRKGLGPELCDYLQNSGIAHVIYSSCNSRSLARDLAQLPAYQISQAQVFDMFPNTWHAEVLCQLDRKTGTAKCL